MVRRKVGEEGEPGEQRLALPARGLLEQEGGDSEEEGQDPLVRGMVRQFRWGAGIAVQCSGVHRLNLVTAAKAKGEEEFISLPGGQGSGLSCSLESGLGEEALYLRTEAGLTLQNYHGKQSSLSDPAGAAPASHQPHVGKKKLKKLAAAERARTKGKDWFHMPALELTEERKADLELLQMRGVLDPKRFYKKNTSDNLPKYFQVSYHHFPL
jgi:hypothetical protein